MVWESIIKKNINMALFTAIASKVRVNTNDIIHCYTLGNKQEATVTYDFVSEFEDVLTWISIAISCRIINFNVWWRKRSTALFKLLSWKQSGLISDIDFEQLSEETKNKINIIEALGNE